MDIQETILRVAKDPYSENVTHSGLHPESINKIINELFWKTENSCNRVILEVEKEKDDHHVSVRVVKKDLV
jgi:hypothetical protein